MSPFPPTIDDLGDGRVPSLSMGYGRVLANMGTILVEGYSGIIGFDGDGTATIDNYRTFTVEGDVMSVGVTFNNTGGTVTVQEGGNLRLSGGGLSESGTFELGDNTSLTFG